MKIRTVSKYSEKQTQHPLTVEHLFESRLDGSSYDRGNLEAIRARAEANSQVIGRLVQILIEAEVLTADDIGAVLGLASERCEVVEEDTSG